MSVDAPRRLLGSTLRLQPNPIRAGDEMSIMFSGVPGDTEAFLDIYDVTGRRISEVRLAPGAETRFLRIGSEDTARWSAGIYFARVRGAEETAGRFIVLR